MLYTGNLFYKTTIADTAQLPTSVEFKI